MTSSALRTKGHVARTAVVGVSGIQKVLAQAGIESEKLPKIHPSGADVGEISHYAAAELGLPCVIVPRYPGLTSALGLLMCDVKHDYTAAIALFVCIIGVAILKRLGGEISISRPMRSVRPDSPAVPSCLARLSPISGR